MAKTEHTFCLDTAYHGNVSFQCTDEAENVLMRSLYDSHVPVKLRHYIKIYLGMYFYSEAKLVESLMSTHLYRKPNIFENWMRFSVLVDIAGEAFLKPIEICKDLLQEEVERRAYIQVAA